MRRTAYGRDRGLTLRMLLTTFMLGGVFVAFFVVMLQVANVGLVPAIVFTAILATVQYYTSDKIALATSGAKVVTPEQAPELHAMVDRLCAMADLPKPRVAVVPTDVPNAFATGRSPRHSAVAVTRGLWERLEPREVEGVLAHELAHIAHRDVLIMTLASFFSMVAGMVVRFGMFGGMGRSRDNQGAAGAFAIVLVVSLVTYALSWLLIMAISRYREFAADRGAALVTGAPENLMSALQKIASGIAQIPQRDLREVERMNAFFIVPTNWRQAAGQLFMTHPPLEKRLERLAAIAQEMGRPVPA
jgi:heat shock protein HtpX